MKLKKLMSLLLSAVMIFTLVPTVAFAEGEDRVVNFNTTIGSFSKRPAVYTDVATPAINELTAFSGDGYYFAKKTDGSFFCQTNPDTFKVDDGNGGYYVPIYLYKVENGTVVSMDGEETVISGSMKEYWKTEKITVNNTVIWKLIPVVSKYNKSNLISGALEIWDASNATVISRTYSLTTGPSKEYSLGDYGFTIDSDSSDGLSGFNQFIDVANDVGRDMVPQTFYLAKSVNGTVSYVLEDEIDVSSLKVSTTDDSLLDVAFVIKTLDKNEDVLGFTFNTKSNTAERMEELKISFKTLNSSEEYYIYGGVECRPRVTAATSVTVDNIGDFLYYYKNIANGSTIYLETGTYSLDFVHDRGVHVLPVDGAEVIFNGTADTTKPVVTIAAGMPGRLGNFIIDGREKTKTGITAVDGYMLVDNDRIIRDCNIAVEYTTGGMFQLNNAVLENNKTAIVVGDYSDIKIKNNKFIGNTTDVKVQTTKPVSVTQNYFGGDIPKIDRNVENTTVYYSPFYIDEERTILTADLKGAEPVSAARTTTQNLTLPVDLTVNPHTSFDNRLFNEMKKPESGSVSVEIPVTEGFEVGGNNPPQNKVSTIWGFDNGEGNLAATLPANGMDLKVTSVPSDDAKAIVTNTVANTKDIVQYVNFSHDGALPGTATVKVLASSAPSAEDLELYYINETTGKVEKAEICAVEKVQIGDEWYYVVTVSHCSEYIITTNVVEKQPTGGEDSGSTQAPSATPTPSPSATTAPTATTKPTATKAPEVSSANDFVSAVEIETKLEKAVGDEVVVNVEDKNLVSPKAFELLEEYPDKTLVFEGEDFEFSFAGKDLVKADVLGDKTFDATIKLESPNEAEIKAAAGDAELVHVYFAHHGELPGKATVKVKAGKEHADTTKYLHYFNDKDNTFEYISEVKLDAEGWAEFVIEHCSDYVLADRIIETSAQEENTQATEKEESTGETVVEPTTPEKTTSAVPFIAIAVVIVAAVIIFIKKKSKAE